MFLLKVSNRPIASVSTIPIELSTKAFQPPQRPILYDVDFLFVSAIQNAYSLKASHSYTIKSRVFPFDSKIQSRYLSAFPHGKAASHCASNQRVLLSTDNVQYMANCRSRMRLQPLIHPSFSSTSAYFVHIPIHSNIHIHIHIRTVRLPIFEFVCSTFSSPKVVMCISNPICLRNNKIGDSSDAKLVARIVTPQSDHAVGDKGQTHTVLSRGEGRPNSHVLSVVRNEAFGDTSPIQPPHVHFYTAQALCKALLRSSSLQAHSLHIQAPVVVNRSYVRN